MLSELKMAPSRTANLPPAHQHLQRSYTARTTAKNIEVLAGAGRLENARSLATQLLAFDRSEETKALLSEHLTRAGHPELLPP